MEFFADHGTHLQLKVVLEEILSPVCLLQSQLELSPMSPDFAVWVN